MAGTLWAIQQDGSRIPVETWVHQAWLTGTLTDPFLREPLERAVFFNFSPGWPRPN